MKALCLFFFCSAAFAQTPDRTHVNPSDRAPFSSAVVVGDTVYLAGHIGVDPKTSKVPAKAEDEARAVLDAFRKSVEAAGAAMDDLVSVQVFCSDVSHFDAWNTVYRTYFKGKFPARAFIGSGKLLFDARFEIQGIAVKRRK